MSEYTAMYCNSGKKKNRDREIKDNLIKYHMSSLKLQTAGDIMGAMY